MSDTIPPSVVFGFACFLGVLALVLARLSGRGAGLGLGLPLAGLAYLLIFAALWIAKGIAQ